MACVTRIVNGRQVGYWTVGQLACDTDGRLARNPVWVGAGLVAGEPADPGTTTPCGARRRRLVDHRSRPGLCVGEQGSRRTGALTPDQLAEGHYGLGVLRRVGQHAATTTGITHRRDPRHLRLRRPVGTTDEGRLCRITQHLPASYAARLLQAGEAGASETELAQIVAEGFAAHYIREGGRRAPAWTSA